MVKVTPRKASVSTALSAGERRLLCKCVIISRIKTLVVWTYTAAINRKGQTLKLETAVNALIKARFPKCVVQ